MSEDFHFIENDISDILYNSSTEDTLPEHSAQNSSIMSDPCTNSTHMSQLYGLPLCSDLISSTVMTSKSDESGSTILDWLQMFGIFMAALTALAIITLLTCRRPKKTIQVISLYLLLTNASLQLLFCRFFQNLFPQNQSLLWRVLQTTILSWK